MKTRNLVLVILSIAVFFIIVIGWNSASADSNNSQTQGSILYVKQGSSGDCSTWTNACELQNALSIAVPGDQIWVAAGTYKPTAGSDRTATFQLIPGVAIYGGFPPGGGDWDGRDWETYITTLSGDIGTPNSNTDNSYHVVIGGGTDASAVLDGFTISGGNANGGSTNNYGGGMYNDTSSPTLTNVIFSNNIADTGGGMSNWFSSSPTMTNVIFNNNVAGQGGGMYNGHSCSPTLTSVSFIENSADYGGGMRNYSGSSPTLNYVTFINNSATYQGGGIFSWFSSSLILTNVTFSGNTANDSGGGMYNQASSSPILNNVTFNSNTADYGAGIFNTGDSGAILTNVTFSDNWADYLGGGIYCTEGDVNGSFALTNVTFTGNVGGGEYNACVMFIGANCDFTLVNTIIWGNIPDFISGEPGGTITVTYSDIQGPGVYPGTGNIIQDPLLGPLADNGGFTLTHALGVGSPAIDAGDPNPDNCPATDQRGFPRPVDGDGVDGPCCDMGAYEAEVLVPDFPIYLPMILR